MADGHTFETAQAELTTIGQRTAAAFPATHARLRAQIEELETAQQRIAAGEARFRRVFEGNPLPMWITDHATGGFIAVNEAALSLYGYSRAEFLALKASALEMANAGVHDPSISFHQRKDGGSISLSIATQRIEFDGRSADLVSAYDLTPRLEVIERRQHSGFAARILAAAPGRYPRTTPLMRSRIPSISARRC